MLWPGKSKPSCSLTGSAREALNISMSSSIGISLGERTSSMLVVDLGKAVHLKYIFLKQSKERDSSGAIRERGSSDVMCFSPAAGQPRRTSARPQPRKLRIQTLEGAESQRWYQLCHAAVSAGTSCAFCGIDAGKGRRCGATA